VTIHAESMITAEKSILVSSREAPIIPLMSSYSKLFERIRVRPDPEAEVKSDAPRCQWDGCREAGEYRAPVGRLKEGEYFCFCLDHVREYNKGYNYFSGLRDSDIARFQKEALTGHRPTWAIGANPAARVAPEISKMRSGRASYHNRIRDPFNMFGGGAGGARSNPPRERKPKALEAKALETLGLAAGVAGEVIKTRYKELVKRHHPDANGGNRGSEDRLREVIQAYRLLKQAGFC
jgi:curved DNA-binding protein CbpA